MKKLYSILLLQKLEIYNKNYLKSVNFIWNLSCCLLNVPLIPICKSQKLDGLSKDLAETSWILTQHCCQQQPTLLCLQIFVVSWRIEPEICFHRWSINIGYFYLLFLTGRTLSSGDQESHLNFHSRQSNPKLRNSSLSTANSGVIPESPIDDSATRQKSK